MVSIKGIESDLAKSTNAGTPTIYIKNIIPRNNDKLENKMEKNNPFL